MNPVGQNEKICHSNIKGGEFFADSSSAFERIAGTIAPALPQESG
jgi:hypothetical protein